MGDQEPETLVFQIVKEKQPKLQQADQHVIRFLDSLDTYLTLFDSLSRSLRQGWLDLASARHSMGASRVNCALLDHKSHSASTSVQVTEHHDAVDNDSVVKQPHFTLRKWGNEKYCSREQKPEGDTLQEKMASPELRYRGDSPSSDKTSVDGASLENDDQIQKERSRSLSVFGTLVSPKLRDAQLSFETALETVVEIANMRCAILSTFDQVHNELEVSEHII